MARPISTTDTSMMTAVLLWTPSLASTRGAFEGETHEGEVKCTCKSNEDKSFCQRDRCELVALPDKTLL